MADDYATWSPLAEQNLTDEDVERLQMEVARLKDAERYWTDKSYRAKYERLGAAGEAYFQELRGQNADLATQLRASRAELEQLRSQPIPDERVTQALQFIRATWEPDQKWEMMNRLLAALEDVWVVMNMHCEDGQACPFTFEGTCKDLQKRLRQIGPLFGRPADYYNRPSLPKDAKTE